MSDKAMELKLIRDAAAGWYARLNNSTVSTETIRAFREWRQDERHAEAYREIDAFWRRVARLQDDPEINRAAGEALARTPENRIGPLPRPGGKTLGAAVFVVLLAVAAPIAWPKIAGQSYGTGRGEQRFVTLADGSRLKLDTDSRVTVRLGGPTRRLTLDRGRAYFEVAHDAAHPFVVRAGDTEVRALGTRFDVRREDGDVAVTLLEGRVRVDGPAAGQVASWTLSPGQQVVVGRAASEPAVRAVDTAQAVAWTSGRLVFQHRPLGEAIAEVNRYGRQRIVLKDPALAARPMTGSFDIGDTEAFVAAVSDLLDLKAEPRGGEILLRPAA